MAVTMKAIKTMKAKKAVKARKAMRALKTTKNSKMEKISSVAKKSNESDETWGVFVPLKRWLVDVKRAIKDYHKGEEARMMLTGEEAMPCPPPWWLARKKRCLLDIERAIELYMEFTDSDDEQ